VCPECDAAVALEDGVERGEVVTCPECSAELEVIGLEPPRFVLAPPEEVDLGE
jgi:alpha-aminoadipate carrier protein LysW